MNVDRLLIAGIGNIFFGDDGFGVEVAARLARCELPPGVCVVDFGIRGYHLAYALVDGYEKALLVDATPRGGRPGDLYLIRPDHESATDQDHATGNGQALQSPAEAAATQLDAHAMDPLKVLQMARSLGPPLPELLLLGCEPMPTGAEMQMQLSRPMQAAVEEAVQLIEALIPRLLAGEPVDSLDALPSTADRR